MWSVKMYTSARSCKEGEENQEGGERARGERGEAAARERGHLALLPQELSSARRAAPEQATSSSTTGGFPTTARLVEHRPRAVDHAVAGLGRHARAVRHAAYPLHHALVRQRDGGQRAQHGQADDHLAAAQRRGATLDDLRGRKSGWGGGRSSRAGLGSPPRAAPVGNSTAALCTEPTLDSSAALFNSPLKPLFPSLQRTLSSNPSSLPVSWRSSGSVTVRHTSTPQSVESLVMPRSVTVSGFLPHSAMRASGSRK